MASADTVHEEKVQDQKYIYCDDSMGNVVTSQQGLKGLVHAVLKHACLDRLET